MRNCPRILAAVALVGGLLVLGCESPLEPLSESADQVGKASSFTTNIVTPFSQQTFVACTNDGAGEQVTLSGKMHIVIHSTVTPSGHIVMKSNLHARKVQGVGMSTGDRYRFTSGSRETVTVKADGFPFTRSATSSFRVAGRGSGNDLTVHHNTQFTADNKGQTRVDFSETRTECR